MAHYFCTAVEWLSESKKSHQNCLMSSAQLLYGLCLRSVAHSWLFHECATPTRPGTPLHMTQFYQASPILVLQATNTRVRRPGCNTRHSVLFAHCKLHYQKQGYVCYPVACLSLPVYIHCHAQHNIVIKLGMKMVFMNIFMSLNI